MSRALFSLTRAWKLAILGWACKHMTKHHPTHPDLPKVILLRHWWENAK